MGCVRTLRKDHAVQQPERIAIVGSREYSDLDAVRTYVRALALDATVISGGSRGVERTAEETARECGLTVRRIRPQANMSGPERYAIRNQMIVEQADRVVAFWDGASEGTRDLITRAAHAGKPLEIYQPG
jgi:hypothetical protein